MKKQIIAVAAVLSIIPAVAFAGPSLGIGYSNVGLSGGHAGRPGVTISAGNLYGNNVVASGSATLANGYYGFHADLGKLVPAGGAVSFEPYVSMGFTNINYAQAPSMTDFYGLAGANLNIPIGSKVAFLLGGGYGHTIDTFSGANGAVYKGKAEVGFEIAPHVTANINVRYLHVPGQSVTTEGAGLAYSF
ncbi:hypothetical protein BBC27_08075 [Acidithiobacillus ferrivorans]|uniref:Outer membrane protein beta-barrel domain-containing protein n=1 Tax=Acidithiobacillus ferrivorans TaxID=160808 RepID=A0A1B9C0I2_9PROT|nr:hypothetical protein [Acidithiobacillus ferrivorans]OCB03413.1 hypothetical protein BBC27_08075 [Acidithiobacillus ferrivorans]